MGDFLWSSVTESLRHHDVCTGRISAPPQVTCIPSNLVTQTDPRQVRTYRCHVGQERQPYLETRRKAPACPGLELIVHVFILSGKLHAASTKERHVGLMQHWKRSERHAVPLELGYARYTEQQVDDQRRDTELPELLQLLSRSRLLATPASPRLIQDRNTSSENRTFPQVQTIEKKSTRSEATNHASTDDKSRKRGCN